MTLEGRVKWDEETQDLCFIQVFLGCENCYIARRNGAESQLCNSIHLHLIVQMWKGRAEQSEQQGEQQLVFARKTLTNADIKNHTQQQRGITQTFWESWCFKAIHAGFQSDIQKSGRIVILKAFSTALLSVDLDMRFPHQLFQM